MVRMVGYINDKGEYDTNMQDTIDLNSDNDDDDDKHKICNGNLLTSIVDSQV